MFKEDRMREKIPGTYCPLCGDIGLFKARIGNEVWAYCGNGAKGPKDAHTAYVIDVIEEKKETRKAAKIADEVEENG